MMNTFVFDENNLPRSSDIWALEASAGTGKTWTIEHLVTEYLAQGIAQPDEVVIVTFTKAAANELRARIRGTIAAATSEASTRNEDQRLALQKALANFGQLRISTIHAFAQRSLATLGQPIEQVGDETGDDDFIAGVLAEALRTLPEAIVRQIVQIPSAQRWASDVFKVWQANPSAVIVNTGDPAYTDAMTSWLEAARALATTRQHLLGRHDYNDLLVALAEALRTPRHAMALADSIKILLIDEFQDTDGLQLEIFDAIATHGSLEAYVVVGDPKQAIYSFRGGDVQVYREAVHTDTAHVLRQNFRSSRVFIEGANEFFAGVDFGLSLPKAPVAITDTLTAHSAYIPYDRVDAAGPRASATEIQGWVVRRGTSGQADAARKYAVSDMVRLINNYVANESIPDPSSHALRGVTFSDICILVATNEFGAMIASSLQRAGIPTSLLGVDNVFASEAATQWGYLLQALSQPSRASSARLLAVSWFGGHSAAEVHRELHSPRWFDSLQEQLISWHEMFLNAPRHEFFDAVLDDSGALERLTSYEGAERHITDLVHLAELLRERETDSLSQLYDYVSRTSSRGSDDDEDTEVEGGRYTRRIADDRSAVSIMTVHRAKGLEFPIVFVPYLAQGKAGGSKAAAYRVLNEEGRGQSAIDIGVGANGKVGKAIKSAQAKSEGQRRAYVAFTRAMYRNVVWLWPKESAHTPKPAIHTTEEWDELIEAHPDLFLVDTTQYTTLEPSMAPASSRELATMGERRLAAPTRRLSYSAMTYALTRSTVAQFAADRESDDDDGASAALLARNHEQYDDLVSSVMVGKVVHRVFELWDPERHDAPSIDELVTSAAAEFGLVLDVAVRGRIARQRDVVALVERSSAAPLHPFAPDLTLADFGPSRRLSEVGFDFVVPAHVTTSDVIDVLRRHLGGDGAFVNWLNGLEVSDSLLKGALTGSIDAVLVTGDAMAPKCVVVDYKTNRLGDEGAINYDHPTMLAAMDEHHYQLQAVVYLVALHRYLRSRLADYDYERHVGGAAYLFVRGLDAAMPGHGIVWLQPSAECISELSDLFEGGLRV